MYLLFLFLIISLIFKNAFLIYFFNDDFFFLKISKINNFIDFLNFFSPFKNYFYRPLSTEVFYFIIHFLNKNIFISHVLVFITYFIGLYFLYKIIILIFKNEFLAYLTVSLYGINFTHVFQLYSFSTFQEIASFSFLSISFYYFLKEKYFISITFFILGLMSKESAILYFLFLIIFSLISKKITKKIIYYFLITLLFILIYKNGLYETSKIDIYRIQYDIKIVINNALWYFLWSLGLPNFTPDYLISIFKPPIKEFWKLLKNFPEIKIYYLILVLYYFLIIISNFFFLLKNVHYYLLNINGW